MQSMDTTAVNDGLIMSRPVDCELDEVSKVCTPYSPKNVMFSGWVGDDDATFNGMRGCLRKVIYSAWLGYGNYGCDIGGYRGNSDTKDKELFVRWAQHGAFLPLMENGGGGEHKPWMYDTEVIDIYRKFVNEHHRLSSYLLTVGANAVENSVSTLIPLDQGGDKFEINGNNTTKKSLIFRQPTTFSYLLGSVDILVHPVVYDDNIKESVDGAVVTVEFPQASDYSDAQKVSTESTVWLDWWSPVQARNAHKAGEKTKLFVPLGTLPVYVRLGALLPLQQQTDSSGKAVPLQEQTTLFTWFGPSKTITENSSARFEMRQSAASGGRGVVGTAYFSTDDTIVASLTANDQGKFGIELVGVSKPTGDVTIDAWPGSLCHHSYESIRETLTVSCESIRGGLKITVDGVSPTVAEDLTQLK